MMNTELNVKMKTFTKAMSDDQLGLRDLHLMVQDLIVWNKFGINLFGRR